MGNRRDLGDRPFVLRDQKTGLMYYYTKDDVPHFGRMRFYASRFRDADAQIVSAHIAELTGKAVEAVHYDDAAKLAPKKASRPRTPPRTPPTNGRLFE